MPIPEKTVQKDRFPEPQNFDEIIQFLRTNCRVSQVWLQDADKIKMTCKDSNEDEDVAKMEFVIEISHHEPQEYQREKISETALKLFDFWKDLQISKG